MVYDKEKKYFNYCQHNKMSLETQRRKPKKMEMAVLMNSTKGQLVYVFLLIKPNK